MGLVYETARDKGGEFCVSNVDETVFTKHFGETEDAIYTRKMSLLDTNFSFKTLIKEGDTNFVGSEYCEYRWIDAKLFHSIPFYVFDNFMAFLIFNEQTVVHLIESEDIAKAQKAQFNLIWDNARIPDA